MIDKEMLLYRLEKSRETLRDAEILLESGSLFSAVNRIYYSMFYAVVALLGAHGYSSSKHSGVRAFFNQHFVKSGIVSKEIGKFYETIFNERQEGDYIDYTDFTEEQVREYYQKCMKYVAIISSLAMESLENSSEQ